MVPYVIGFVACALLAVLKPEAFAAVQNLVAKIVEYITSKFDV